MTCRTLSHCCWLLVSEFHCTWCWSCGCHVVCIGYVMICWTSWVKLHWWYLHWSHRSTGINSVITLYIVRSSMTFFFLLLGLLLCYVKYLCNSLVFQSLELFCTLCDHLFGHFFILITIYIPYLFLRLVNVIRTLTCCILRLYFILLFLNGYIASWVTYDFSPWLLTIRTVHWHYSILCSFKL